MDSFLIYGRYERPRELSGTTAKPAWDLFQSGHDFLAGTSRFHLCGRSRPEGSWQSAPLRASWLRTLPSCVSQPVAPRSGLSSHTFAIQLSSSPSPTGWKGYTLHPSTDIFSQILATSFKKFFAFFLTAETSRETREIERPLFAAYACWLYPWIRQKLYTSCSRDVNVEANSLDNASVAIAMVKS